MSSSRDKGKNFPINRQTVKIVKDPSNPEKTTFCPFPISTKRVTLINFGLGRQFSQSSDILHDRRGSPAYISPEVLTGMTFLEEFINFYTRTQ